MSQEMDQELEPDMTPLSLDEAFSFRCDPEVPCFNECCRDLSQLLTPYDILRLSRGLNLRTGEFLRRHTTHHSGPETGLPVVSLRQEAATGYACPFVSADGCEVYEDRPSSCRAYPLARIATRDRASGTVRERYYLLREPHCQGHEVGRTITVRQWVDGQGLDRYNRATDRFVELIALKNQRHPQPLDMKERHIFHLGCYDLDQFRDQILAKEPSAAGATEEARERASKALAGDDEALLSAGMAWVIRLLFS